MNPIQAIFVLILIVIAIMGLLMGLAHLITRVLVKPEHSKNKSIAYECGVVGQPAKSSRVSARFYLLAMLFVLFDIEIIFLYPWAIAYRDFIENGAGLYYFLSLIVFLVIFILGLIWEMRVKALDWR